MTGPEARDDADARMRGLLRGLRGVLSLRRHEKRRATYALRMLSLGLIGVVLTAKLVQLGPAGAGLALLKVAAGAGAAFLALWLALFVDALLRKGGENA